MPEGTKVRTLFSEIAGRYDTANRALSFGIDRGWRKKMVALVTSLKPSVVADLATGSGDVAFAIKRALPKEAEVTGYDFCQPMLDEAIRKRELPRWAEPGDKIDFLIGDCLNLPLADNSVDVITIAFGLRNLENRVAGLAEMHRVLRPGGSLIVLEFSQPQKLFRPFYYFYLKTLLPLVAGWITKRRSAYVYLADSIEAFPDREALKEEFRAGGFEQIEATGLTFGVVALHHATKNR
jgi:demethylmenaquinone methyltransferase/2-methoxy-6-polyprenyl-1,4-benzoquinol methylase